MEKKKKGGAAGRVISLLIPAVLLVIFAYSSYMLATSLLRYREADRDYAELGKMITVETSVEATAGGNTDAAEAGTVAPQAEPLPDFPPLAIDYAGLARANADFACVIHIPALGVTYPVTYTEDNDRYLTETFDGKRNPAGSIFVDSYAARGFTDRKTIIYGHNMKNGSMFGKLKNFSRDPSLAAADPYFFLYFPDRIEKYRIFAYFVISNEDETIYSPVGSDEEYDRVVRVSQGKSAYQPSDLEFDFAGRPRLVTLSTCYGSGHTDNFVVQGALVDTKAAE
ncbi:class B sortase [Clostridium vitabionis]|uniref:class B sortase n=1 Tax=Clostridium vitabionis TaxID=2784388 RepID=UPI00188B989C|nr:class B sortase [Clostridium vitabionis]